MIRKILSLTFCLTLLVMFLIIYYSEHFLQNLAFKNVFCPNLVFRPETVTKLKHFLYIFCSADKFLTDFTIYSNTRLTIFCAPVSIKKISSVFVRGEEGPTYNLQTFLCIAWCNIIIKTDISIIIRCARTLEGPLTKNFKAHTQNTEHSYSALTMKPQMENLPFPFRWYFRVNIGQMRIFLE